MPVIEANLAPLSYDLPSSSELQKSREMEEYLEYVIELVDQFEVTQFIRDRRGAELPTRDYWFDSKARSGMY